MAASLTAFGQEQQATQKEAPPKGTTPKAFKIPAKQRFTLPNGMHVTLVPYGSIPKATILVAVRAGNLNESGEQVWLADLTGALMKEGTASRSAEQVAAEAASMGGVVDVGVGADLTTVSIDVLSEFAPKAAQLVADVTTHPLLPASEVERLKKDQLRRLAIGKTQPGLLALERFRRALYGDHPYGRVFATEAMVTKYTAGDARKFYAANFGAARTHVYVAGKFDPAAVKAALTQAFTGWAKGPDPLIDPPKVEAKHALETVDKPGAAQSTLYVGIPALDPSNPDYIGFTVMNNLLGGSFGSRITSNIREQKGYTYSPNSQVSVRYRDGYWVEVADVTTKFTGPSIKEILGEVDKLANTAPPDAELDGIKNYMAGVFVLRNSTRGGVAGQLSFLDLHGLGDEYLDTYVQKVYAITPQQVSEMVKKYIQADKMTIVVVGDQKVISDQIAPYQTASVK